MDVFCLWSHCAVWRISSHLHLCLTSLCAYRNFILPHKWLLATLAEGFQLSYSHSATIFLINALCLLHFESAFLFHSYFFLLSSFLGMSELWTVAAIFLNNRNEMWKWHCVTKSSTSSIQVTLNNLCILHRWNILMHDEEN